MDPRSRRDFLRAGLGLTGLSLLAGCGVVSAPGQGTARMPRIGFLASGPREDFLRGLRDHGYEPGQNIHIEYRFNEGRSERFPELATELVDLQPDLIVAIGGAGPLAAKQATSTIPIVAVAVPDPVGSGLVASLARPGGNVTALSTLGDGMDMKRMERLKEVVPRASRVAVLGNPDGPGYRARLANFEAAALVLGQQVRLAPSRTADDLAGAFAAAADWGADALLVPSGPTTNYPTRVVELATQHRLPTFYEHREFTDLGGLATFGPNFPEIYRRAAAYVDRILKGAKPTDLPVEEPTTFEFVINLNTAHVLGLTIPQSVLADATEVIQ
jgi:putative tryptophan/tyrosine transport system substrate-binding protein